MDFQEWPKIELHVHLDCSLGFEVVNELESGITDVEFQSRFMAPAKCLNLPDFLARVEDSINVLQTERALTAATLDLMQQFKADGVIYAEIRFAPILHTRRGLAADEVVEIVADALGQGMAKTGVEAGLLLCTLRTYDAQQSLETAMLANRFRGRRVVGFDIAGDELAPDPHIHEVAYTFARQHGIPATAHSGEARGPESMWQVLRQFKPRRIGHGVRCIEDPALVDYLIKHRIHLEVCPTSNVQTNVFSTLADHTIDRLYKAGVSVGINTDGRTTANVTLAEEYRRLHNCFGWGPEHFLRCNLDALEAAFVGEELRKELGARLRGEGGSERGRE